MTLFFSLSLWQTHITTCRHQHHHLPPPTPHSTTSYYLPHTTTNDPTYLNPQTLPPP
ncbi:hypothetical protein HanRHA438_Chr17g0833411 [Helianthus annuus]|nr:hypothetical protein HanRHA438_Chr17g0833411 [Helianthus annuus]